MKTADCISLAMMVLSEFALIALPVVLGCSLLCAMTLWALPRDEGQP